MNRITPTTAKPSWNVEGRIPPIFWQSDQELEGGAVEMVANLWWQLVSRDVKEALAPDSQKGQAHLDHA